MAGTILSVLGGKDETDRIIVYPAGRDLPPGLRVPVCRWHHKKDPGCNMPERRKTMKNTTIPIFPHHILKDGRKIILTSNHGFKFSDGTEFPGLPKDFPMDFLDALAVKREFREVSAALPNKATESRQSLPKEALEILSKLSMEADIILVSFMVISALKEMGIRNLYPKVLAFNATPETTRSSPQEKVVDITNWAW